MERGRVGVAFQALCSKRHCAAHKRCCCCGQNRCAGLFSAPAARFYFCELLLPRLYSHAAAASCFNTACLRARARAFCSCFCQQSWRCALGSPPPGASPAFVATTALSRHLSPLHPHLWAYYFIAQTSSSSPGCADPRLILSKSGVWRSGVSSSLRGPLCIALFLLEVFREEEDFQNTIYTVRLGTPSFSYTAFWAGKARTFISAIALFLLRRGGWASRCLVGRLPCLPTYSWLGGKACLQRRCLCLPATPAHLPLPAFTAYLSGLLLHLYLPAPAYALAAACAAGGGCRHLPASGSVGRFRLGCARGMGSLALCAQHSARRWASHLSAFPAGTGGSAPLPAGRTAGPTCAASR